MIKLKIYRFDRNCIETLESSWTDYFIQLVFVGYRIVGSKSEKYICKCCTKLIGRKDSEAFIYLFTD